MSPADIEARAGRSMLDVLLVEALPHPVLMIGASNEVLRCNAAAEQFFMTSQKMLRKHGLTSILPFDSPMLALLDQVRDSNASVSERKVDLSSPRIGDGVQVDVYAAPVGGLDDRPMTILFLEERSMADKIDRQLNHRGAARTVTGLASMLAHEIKNPLAGIRGAAQLLEGAIDAEDDRALTGLIQAETDRIVALVDRMEVFSDERPPILEPVNIHAALETAKLSAQAGFASHIRITERYDPSLPLVRGNRDQLVQVFLNLVKNAAEAIGQNSDGEITLSTAFRPGMRMAVPGGSERLNLPLECTITDNGGGISPELARDLFDPFVTTKTNGTGLGLALVAKVIRDHGGVVEHRSHGRKTTFSVLLPMHEDEDGNIQIGME
ncbi:MAG: ATP-binding protein [Pseudomonadota bacterium]